MTGRASPAGGAPAPEFSRVFDTRQPGPARREVTIEAEPHEAAALAARLGLVALDRLSATLAIARTDQGRLIRVTGRLTARVVQHCVVSLEPVASEVADEIRASYVEPRRLATRLAVVELDPFSPDDDDPEPLVDGCIDIGELTAQCLSLALDPYPRAPGVSVDDLTAAAAPPGADPASGDNPQAAAPPFATLDRLRRRGRE